MICDAWEIVVVPFPFTDRAGTKERPALVLSRESFNRGASHTLLAMITTRAHSPWPGDTLISDRSTTGLPVPCTVRLKLFTLDNRLVLRKLGRLSRHDEAAIKSQLTDMLPVKREFGVLHETLSVGPEFTDPLPPEELEAWGQ